MTLSHYDKDFYHSADGCDIHKWVTDSVMGYDEIDAEAEIADLPTVHLRTDRSPQAYGFDEYYFISGDRLFRSMILHVDDEADCDLHNKSLSGLTFS